MFKKNKVLLVIILFVIALCSFLIYKGVIDISILLDADKDIHFNLLTVSSIIGGFMFSGLGLIVGVSGNRLVKELERASLMDRVYNNIIVGIVFSVISMILSLTVIFNVLDFSDAVKKAIVAAEVITLTLGISCFFLAVVDLKFIISSIHKESKVVPDAVLSEMKKQIKKGNKKEVTE